MDKGLPEPADSAASSDLPATESDRGGEKVESHPDKELISRMIQSGWSPRKIETWLRNKYPDDKDLQVSERTLYSYRKNFEKLDLIIPVTVYEKAIKELDVCIDSLSELYKAIAIQKQRISHLLAVENTNKIALPDTRKEMELLTQMIVDSLDIEMRLGIRREVPSELNIEARILSLDALVVKYLDRKKVGVSDSVELPE